MPLIKGAKPGTKNFGKNVASERKSGRPLNQSLAIAFSEAKAKPKRKSK